jgi:periplasmic divalent cation tolerance protein
MASTRPSLVIVTTSLDKPAAARRLARLVIHARLAACVQAIPIRSLYRWKGKVESAPETLLLAKTTSRRARALMAFIRRHHPYELPEILVSPVTGALAGYRDWVERETRVAPFRRART